jgi:hypothetical protein
MKNDDKEDGLTRISAIGANGKDENFEQEATE